MNLNLASAVRTTKSVITANSPVLLVGAAVAGLVTTGVLAAKGGYKARGIVDAYREETGEEPTPVEIAKLTWLCYAVPAVTGASTIASVFGVHMIHTKRHAALAGLYVAATGKLDDYREEAEKLLGAKKTQELNNVIGQRAVDAHAEDFVNSEIVVTPGGTELCFDEWGGRWFHGSIAAIQEAVSKINLQLATDGDANVNELYDHLGLQPTQVGVQGWSGTKIEVRFGTVQAPDGRSATSFRFQQEPKALSRS